MTAKTEAEKRIVSAWIKKGEARIVSKGHELRRGKLVEIWEVEPA